MNTSSTLPSQEALHALSLRTALWILLLAALVVLCTWVRPLNSSLWLDETVTAWITADGVERAIERSHEFADGHTLYYIVATCARKLPLPLEVALRLPSLLAMLGAAVFLFLLARRASGPLVASVTVLLFVCLKPISFEACNARPYALALLCIAAAGNTLHAYLARPSFLRAAAVVAFGTLSVNFQVLFVLGLPALALAALIHGRQSRRPLLILGAALAVGAAVTQWSHIAELRTRGESLGFAAQPRVEDLLATLMPPLVAVLLLIALALRLRTAATPARSESRETAPSGPCAASVLSLAWIAVPPLALFALSRLGSNSLFVDRYMLPMQLGLALLGGRCLGVLPSTRVIMVLALVCAVLSCGALSQTRHHDNDWRAAAATMRSAGVGADIPVLFHSGLVEMKNAAWLDDPVQRDYLLAPARCYAFPGTLLLTPYDALSAEGQQQLEQITATTLLKAQRFLLVTRTQTETALRAWLDGRLAGTGLRAHRLAAEGNIRVWDYSRE